MTLAQALKKIKETETVLRNEHHIKALYFFGSLARGDNRSKADIDILVEFSKPVGLFEFARLQDFLKSLLGVPVDLVTRDALKDWMRESIEKELVRAA